MIRPFCHRIRNSLAATGLALGVSLLSGCEYNPPSTVASVKGTVRPGVMPVSSRAKATGPGASTSGRRSTEERKAILENSVTLIQRAAIQPGGAHFDEAVRKLNQYFDGSDPAEYRLDSAARAFLAAQLNPDKIRSIEGTQWELRDTRHIEDCMMYYTIANRVAGTGDDLARVRRIFDWAMRQVQLVPAGSFGGSRLGPAFARPYDVLLRGMASESEGTGWAERAWVFMSLCRQIGIDVGLITFSRGNTVDALVPQQSQVAPRRPQRPSIIWICGALIGDQIYLFDPRVGLEIPGPGGLGVATLAQALEDRTILERMNIPGLVPYTASRAALLASSSRIGILIDSSPGYFSPKMRMLQRELAGKYRSVLFNDPAVERDNFVRALGPRAGTVSLWELPLQVDARLFLDSEYVQAIKNSLFWFKPEFPLVYARVKQLRGEVNEAIEDYVKLRFSVNPVVTNKKQMIPKDVQDGLDVYATYYMGLAHLENNNLDQAELMFRQTQTVIREEPQPGKGQPYYFMFRWGANANLARISELKHNDGEAIDFYTRPDPTSQHVGNLLRARELVWDNPIAPAK